MKKEFIFIAFMFIFIISPFISAEGVITINQQPNEIYNLGDSITIPVIVTAVSNDFSDDINMKLVCNGKSPISICSDGVIAAAGSGGVEKDCTLTKEKIGETTGTCYINVYFSKQTKGGIPTNEFKISNLLTINPNTDEKEFEPGQNILISGDAIKENGQEVNGFINLEIVIGNSSKDNIIQAGTVNNGMYSMNITLPEKLAAGNYLVKLNAYEMTADGSKTNTGFVNYNIAIKQIPTSLELVFENNNVTPGTNMMVKAILHDQTGEKIDSNAIITVKKGTTDIQVQTEKPTDEYLEFPIQYNEPPSNWTVFAISNQLTAEAPFIVIENADIKAEMVNGTLVLTNIGNVPYNNTIFIKIGNVSQPFNLSLGIDESKKVTLDAAAGEHELEVLNDKGDSKLKETITITKSRLTGDAVQIKDASQASIGNFFSQPLVLIFITLVVLAIIFILVKKIRKKTPSYGGGLFKKKVKQLQMNVAWENRAMPLSKDSKLETKNKANLAVSIKGNKQEVSIVNVNVRNLGSVQAQNGNPEEPLQKIINIAENKKAFVYENQGNLFFILTPSKTRALRNEDAALEIAQNAKEILSNYNRIAKYRLDFGISIEYGPIIEKIENGNLEFMSLENLMTVSKRVSSASQGEVLLGEKIKDKLTNVRTEKQDNGRVVSYKIKDIKYHDEEHSRFIKSFLKKAEENKDDFKVI
jgi:hypothetical protein